MREHIDEHGASASQEFPRPVAAPGVAERFREWTEWIGVARLVTSAVAVVVVCAGAWFLVRTPTPPPESSLPTALGGGSLPLTTLAPPSTTAEVDDPVDSNDASTIVVHVAGAVVASGVHELPADARVADAIDLAGGVTLEADPEVINLAAPLHDGSRIYVPMVGEEAPPPSEVVPVGDSGTDIAPGPVDVNAADARTLETLPGIGPATAAAILTERDRNGPFASFEDLERVPGIGPAKLAALEGLVTT